LPPTTTSQWPGGIGPERAARSGFDTDDGRLDIAAAPAAKTVRIVETPVENVRSRQIVVPHLDLCGAGGDVEGEKEVGLFSLGNDTVQRDDRLLSECKPRQGTHNQRGDRAHPSHVEQSLYAAVSVKRSDRVDLAGEQR
jgi:hypothetical protein